MANCRNLLAVVIVLIALIAVLPGCQGEPEPAPQPTPTPTPAPAPAPTPAPTPQPSPTSQNLSNQIAGINPTGPNALPGLLGVSQELNTAQSEGTVSQEEGGGLGEALGDKFSDFVRNQVDDIDPTDLAALNDFWALQRIQGQDEYDRYCDPETKQYKEEQMRQKFNDYIRNWVDHIDPNAPDALNDIFFLQKIQNCKKYADLATPDTHQYKEEQLGQKFNEWVRKAVDDLDPADPDALGEMVFLQKLQLSEKWKEYATPETEQYKKDQLKKKFNEWVRNRVGGLDPNDPNFLDELEKLRTLQLIEKYQELVTPETSKSKERAISEKFGQLVTNLVDAFAPGLMQELADLRTLQSGDAYQELCPDNVKQYKEEQLRVKLTKEAGEIPHVVGTLPEPGQNDVVVSQPILIAFDQPMAPASAEAAIDIWPEVDHIIFGVEDNIIFVLQPLMPLEYSTTYTVKVDAGVMSAAGIMLEEIYDFNFITKSPGEAPYVVETLPLDGQTDAEVGQPIEIAFDQPMEPISVEEAIAVSPAIDYAIFWQEDYSIAVLQPLESLEFNTTYTIDIGTEAISAEGLPLEEDFGFHFITGIVPPPHVQGTMPLNGQADIPSNHPIQIFFDWPMEPASVESALTISPVIDYTVEWLEGNFVLTIRPITTLGAYMRYKIQLDSSAMSADGIPLGVTFSIAFTTRG
ncbi:MAG: Ig-like domain-containing protein [Dehalococcoidales bacterium]